MEGEMNTLAPMELIPDVYQFPGVKQSSHVYLIKGEAKNILIDTGMTLDFPQLATGLQSLGLGVKDVHLVVLTHEHCDHTGAATILFYTSLIAAHTLAANKIELQDDFVMQGKYFDASARPFYAHLWLDEGMFIDLGNHKLQVIHTPGHTSGCICLYEPKERVLFSGDTVFAGGILSGIDGSGSISDYLNSLQRLGNLRIDALFPGHGFISHTVGEDIDRAVAYARSVMEESKLLFEALGKSGCQASILRRFEKGPVSGMARSLAKKSEGGSSS